MSIQKIESDKAPKAIGSYSQGIKAGNLIFTSGQIPINTKTGLIVEGGIKEQTKQVLENLQEVLIAGGTDLSRVLKVTIFIKDMNDFSVINDIYSTFFQQPYPARSCVEVARLPKDVLIEIEAIATT